MFYESKPPIDELMELIFRADSDDYLEHRGVDHTMSTPGSGRHPWGSGEDPYQHAIDIRTRALAMGRNGASEQEICEYFGLSSTELRRVKTVGRNEIRRINTEKALKLKEKGWSTSAIARELSTEDNPVNESSVRLWLDDESMKKATAANATADFLRQQCNEKGLIDISAGVELELGIGRTRFDTAVELLKKEGYNEYKARISQITNKSQYTTQFILGRPDTTWADVYDTENVHSIKDYITRDGGDSFEQKFHYPTSIDGSRIFVRYVEDGGATMDGLTLVRRGVPDLDLGESRISQIRVLVNNSHYIKGMCRYGDPDEIPPGYDIVVMSNKKRGTPLISDNPDAKTVLKPIDTNDPNNPFGATIKRPDANGEHGGQSWYIDENGEKKLSAINKRAESGDWFDQQDSLAAQFAGKQSKYLVEKQVNLTIASKKQEYDDIMHIDNPVVKQKRLRDFAGLCDSAAVHLKLAALPGQKWHAILPEPTLKDTEIYAPHYENGTKLALVRYPHAGTFEIPILTVNNRNPDAKRHIGNAIDIVGINANVAERLSGADFDGDTVMCIPTHDPAGKIKIISTDPLPGLKGFDNKAEYGTPALSKDDPRHMKKGQIGNEMGQISNLIADMDIKGATPEEKARAVRHSMVVIDAYKHHLDYKKSYKDHDILALQKKYQWVVDEDGNKISGGVSTIMTRAKSQASVPETQGSAKINQKGKPWYDPSRPEGALIFKQSGRVKTRELKNGTIKEELRMKKTTKMEATDDAFTLISEYRDAREILYAQFANEMKRMANEARLESVKIVAPKKDPEAAKMYAPEVQSLMDKLKLAELNAPREREALRIANAAMRAREEDNPSMSASEKTKWGTRELNRAREIVGAHRHPIDITPREWEAIQKNAISSTKLADILRFANPDQVSEYSTPRERKGTLTEAKMSKIKMMNASGYSLEEMAKAVGVSASTVSKYLTGKLK